MTSDQPLAADYYTNPAVFDREKERLLFRTWQCVCHVSEISEPGAYVIGDGCGAMSEVGLRHFHNLYRDQLET